MTDPHLTDSEIINAVEARGGKLALPMFDGAELEIFTEYADLDPAKIGEVVRTLLSKDSTGRDEISRHLMAHFEMMKKATYLDQILVELNGVPPTLDTVWKGIKFGCLMLTQTTEGLWEGVFNYEKPIYIVLDLNVPWEREHSVNVSWKNGSSLVRVGDYGEPVHDFKQYGEDHQTCIFHCPEYDLCTKPE